MDIFFAVETGEGKWILLWEGKPGAMKGSNPTSPTFEIEGLDEREILIRKMIYLAALKAGLTNYGNEFWHYEAMTRMAAYYTQQPTAAYGLLWTSEMAGMVVPSSAT
jgi:hypothetical protein